MANDDGGEKSRHDFHVAYHGVQANDHSMDVEALAPALLAFGKLVREANTVLNGDRAKVKVLVTSDFEHRCFNINFEVIQTILEKVGSLLHDDGIKDVKEILGSLGLIASFGTALYGYLKWKKGRNIKQVCEVKDSSTKGLIVIKVQGDSNTIQISHEVFKLAENKNVLDAVMGTIEPIETKAAESLEFRDRKNKTVNLYKSTDVKEIVSSCESGCELVGSENLRVPEQVEPKTVTASLHVYAPVFDNKAKLWRFKYNGRNIYADISETGIAKETMKRGSSGVNDRYRVRMEVMPPDSKNSEPQYKIKEVLDFTPAPQQAALPLPKPKKRRAELGSGRRGLPKVGETEVVPSQSGRKKEPKAPRAKGRRSAKHERGKEEGGP